MGKDALKRTCPVRLHESIPTRMHSEKWLLSPSSLNLLRNLAPPPQRESLAPAQVLANATSGRTYAAAHLLGGARGRGLGRGGTRHQDQQTLHPPPPTARDHSRRRYRTTLHRKDKTNKTLDAASGNKYSLEQSQ